MESPRIHDAEYTKLLATTRYTQHDLIVDGITLIAGLAVVAAVLYRLVAA